MVFTVKESELFTPSWNKNNKLPESERVQVVISLPSAIEVTKAFTEHQNVTVAEFLTYVKEVKNLTVGEEDATPMMVLETPGMAELVVEIRNEYRKYIIDKKK